MKFNYDNIDYFYYHSTDIDVTRLYSMLKYGIMSANYIRENNIPYYHRNYINSSCRDSHVSISHFPITLWRYFEIENELYNSSANRITFILNGNIDVVEKIAYKKQKYTNERHVKTGIRKEDIEGIVIRKIDAFKQIENIKFNLNMTDFNGMLKKLFDTILFFKEVHNYEKNIDELYMLIGKLIENKTYKTSLKEILNKISLYMQKYLKEAYKSILKKEEVNLLDIIKLYSDIPIYIMTKYDIKEEKDLQNLICSAQEKYNLNYPNKEYNKITKKERKKIQDEKRKYLENAKLELQMIESDLRIYYEEYQGPLTKEGYDIATKVYKDK